MTEEERTPACAGTLNNTGRQPNPSGRPRRPVKRGPGTGGELLLKGYTPRVEARPQASAGAAVVGGVGVGGPIPV